MPPTYSIREALNIIATATLVELTAICRVVILETDRYTEHEKHVITAEIAKRRAEISVIKS